jgi:hypothetical protein
MLDELHDARLEFQKLGAGYSPLPLKKSFFALQNIAKSCIFRVTDFEAEANTSRDLTGSRLQRDRSRQHA